MAKTYSIFGAGAAGLYTAWRLLNGKVRDTGAKAKQLTAGDTLDLIDFGHYAFNDKNKGTREPGARVCTWHYKNDPDNSYLEVGGMRYSYWNGDNDAKAGGHRLVTTVIKKLGLDKYAVPFNESTNPLYYLRTKNMYLNQISSNNPAPYNVDNYGAAASPDTGFNIVENLAVTAHSGPQTRAEWCNFYANGVIKVNMPDGSAFKKGDKLSDIGYWNLMFDQLGTEGFNYTSDGNGYSSNVINWNSAVAFQANNEFTPGTEYKTLTKGYSYMFTALFNAIEDLAKEKGVKLNYKHNTRLHSILQVGDKIRYTTASRENPNKKNGVFETDAAWMAMSRAPIEKVAQATRYEDLDGAVDVLNTSKVQLYLESAILQPSYKIGMFFHEPWWADNAKTPPTYPAQINGYEITQDVIEQLRKAGFPEQYLKDIKENTNIFETPFASTDTFVKTVELAIDNRLTVGQEKQLLLAAHRNTIGPSVTDMPIRQVVYFGDNALNKEAKKVYGLLAAYDDETYASFWKEMELGPDQPRLRPTSEDFQTLDGPREPSKAMIKMLRTQLAAVHFGPQSDYTFVPEPLETRFMDWSLPPFNAGYHAWAAHYDVCDVQQKIRKPSSLNPGQDANIFIVGEAYSNDQAWVEGAYCTAESVLNDFFGIEPLIDDTDYPFICPYVQPEKEKEKKSSKSVEAAEVA